MTRTEILRILKQYKSANYRKYGIISLGIFGSYSKDVANDDSDIDIIIETQEPDPYNLVHIKDDLEKIFNKPIDIIRNRKKMNPYLKKRIEKDAQYV